jgi:hypothetical protein
LPLHYPVAHHVVGLPVGSGDDGVAKSDPPNPYDPFEAQGQWDLAYICHYPEPATKSRVIRTILSKYNRSIKDGQGFRSHQDYVERVKRLSNKGIRFHPYNVLPTESAPDWAPELITFWMRDSLEVVKSLVTDPRWSNDMRWAPEEAYNEAGERIYSELWTGNWWRRMQVCRLIGLNLLTMCSRRELQKI